MKKLIALCCRDTKINNTDAYYCQQSYMNALESIDCNYIAVVPTKDHDYTFIANICDGLVVCGGGDMNAKRFNEENHESVGLVKENIDEMDLNVIDAFLKANKPILGICRGHQVLNVYYGGSLIQDIPSQYETNLIHSQKEERHVATHQVVLTKDSCLGKEGTVVGVNTFHHQAVKEVGKSLEVIALGEDGVVEAICNEHVLGVQWHPECMLQDEFHQAIFTWFKSRLN